VDVLAQAGDLRLGLVNKASTVYRCGGPLGADEPGAQKEGFVASRGPSYCRNQKPE